VDRLERELGVDPGGAAERERRVSRPVPGALSSGPPSGAARGPTVVVVTGLSGAGKSTALHALEDLGYFCIDNLPTVLAPQAVEVCEAGGMMRVALGMDVRVRAFLGSMSNVLGELASDGRRDLQVVFLDANDETLLRRFSESRRPHPMDAGPDEDPGARPSRAARRLLRAPAVLDDIHLERDRLAPLRARATRVLDTTHLSVHELRRAIVAHFGPSAEGAAKMLTRVVSFGFKYGTPVDADLVLDVRFLENPYFVPDLKPFPGTDPRVRDFVLALPEAAEFLDKTLALLEFMMPKYEREGKNYLTLGIGCTGGRHRSVVLTERIATLLEETLDADVIVVHRDVARGDAKKYERERDTYLPEAPAEERPSQAELVGVISPALQSTHAPHKARGLK
jgi:RNase adapter protein RapZ